jgi:hypothetical protein
VAADVPAVEIDGISTIQGDTEIVGFTNKHTNQWQIGHLLLAPLIFSSVFANCWCYRLCNLWGPSQWPQFGSLFSVLRI